MKQAGHRLITQQVVDHLFAGWSANMHVLGLDKHDFYQALNNGQARADRWYGDTLHPSWVSPEAQRFHSMADPAKTALRNLEDIWTFVVTQLFVARAAHDRGDTKTEFLALGAAVHAVEDSYSNAHMFRDPQRPDDPHAPIIAINNFSPGGHGQTHDGDFDVLVQTQGHLERRTDQAAVTAVTELLILYTSLLDATNSQAYGEFSAAVGEIYTPASEISVLANNEDASYQADRLAHLANDICRDYAAEHALEQSQANESAGPVTDGHTGPDHLTPAPQGGLLMSHDPGPAPLYSENSQSNMEHVESRPPEGSTPAPPSDAHERLSTSPEVGFVHPTGGVENTTIHSSHGKTFEIQGRDPAEHAADTRFSGWTHVNGKDILCPVGTPVYAVDDGVIGRQFGNSGSKDGQLQGARLHLETGRNEYYYAHLSGLAPGLHPGSIVHKGDLLGYSGIAGGVAHLHFAAKEPHSTMDLLKHASGVEAHDGHHATKLTPPEPGGPTPGHGHAKGSPVQEPGHHNNSANRGAVGAVDQRHDAGGLTMPDGSTGYGSGFVGGAHHDVGMNLPEGSTDHENASISVASHHEGGMSLPVISAPHGEPSNLGASHDGGMSLPGGPVDHAETGGGAMHPDAGVSPSDGGMSLPDGVFGHGNGSTGDGAQHDGGMSLPNSSGDHGDGSGMGPAQGGMSLPDGLIGHTDSVSPHAGIGHESINAGTADAHAGGVHASDDPGHQAG